MWNKMVNEGKLKINAPLMMMMLTKLEEDGDDDDDVYSDALETLSPCVSGVSGMDNLVLNKYKTSFTDKQAQDFMMKRFLPAAKAMTLQPIQHAPRKKSVLVEQPRDFTKLVRKEKKSLVNRHVTDIIPYTAKCQEEKKRGEEEEEEESDHETVDYANISAKGCGLFPHSCIKNSLCFLSSVPETKIVNQFPLCSAYEVGKSNRSSSHHRSAPAIKKAWNAIHKSKSSSRDASGEMKQIGKLASFRRTSGAAAAGIPPFPGARLLGNSKQVENNQFSISKFPSGEHTSIQEVLSHRSKKSSNSRNLSMEKTLYIDTTSTVKSQCSNSCSLVDSFRDMSQQALEENLDCEVLSSTDANSVTLSSMLSLMAKEDDDDERLISDQEMNREHISLQLMQSSLKIDTKINNKQIVVVDDGSLEGSAKCVLPPPLPKSPSESWLCHALPLVSLKNNSFRYSTQGTQQWHAKKEGISKASSGYSKWETIVKTSKFEY